MGFLDRKSRVVDFVLTERGRRLYAAGALDFSYFSLFDDGIDYDPFGATDDADREVQVEALPMLEVPFVRDVRTAPAPLEPTGHLFAASDGYGTVPFMSSPSQGDSLDLMCDQALDGSSYKRMASSVAQIDLALSGEVENVNPGFLVKVYSSGSQGLTRLLPRRDLLGRRSYDPFLSVVVDGERAPDSPRVSNPSTSRSSTDANGPDVRVNRRRR
jgi:hypothetical protein